MNATQKKMTNLNLAKLAEIVRAKRVEILKNNRPHTGQSARVLWRGYLKGQGIKTYTIASFTKIVNEDKLHGKTVMQTDFALGMPAKNQKDMEEMNLDASDIVFYVLDKDLAKKILVLGTMPP